MSIFVGFVPASLARMCVWTLEEVERTKATSSHGSQGLHCFSRCCLAKFPSSPPRALARKELGLCVRPGEILLGEISAGLRTCRRLICQDLPTPQHLQDPEGPGTIQSSSSQFKVLLIHHISLE